MDILNGLLIVITSVDIHLSQYQNYNPLQLKFMQLKKEKNKNV
jgi:hypothetical protein